MKTTKKIKELKGIIALCLMLAVAASLGGPAMVVAEEVNTGFTKSTGSGDAPIILAKWEMNKTTTNAYSANGKDDDLVAANSQFAASGQYQQDKHIWVCAIAKDNDGIGDINNVYANVFYPDNRGFHFGSDNPDYGEYGCGQQIGYELILQPFHATDSEVMKNRGIELFCNRIMNDNYNLPVFADGWDYDKLCNGDGEVVKGTARVYCKYMDLSYEDPAGYYTVQTHASDKGQLNSTTLLNDFKYLSTTAFEIDFNDVNYGNVKEDEHKQINGDLTWDDPYTPADGDKPSVRNIGNIVVLL